MGQLGRGLELLSLDRAGALCNDFDSVIVCVCVCMCVCVCV